MIHKNILETIGKTPLVKLNKLVTANDAELIAKLEFFNPGGSVKDRIGISIVEDAEMKGLLTKGGTIIEPTSGNTGIALAMVAAVKEYRVILTMPENMSLERRSLLKFLGARLILTPSDQGMTGAIQEAERLAGENGYFMPRQFQNPINPETHRSTTAQEIIDDLNGIMLDYFVAGVGTGGTITGIGETFKKVYPNVKIIAVEPFESPVLSGGKPHLHHIQGIGAGFIPEVLNMKIIDEIIKVKNNDAYTTARHLAQNEGILSGISAGANVYAAIQIAKKVGAGKIVIVIVPDGCERYLSTKLFE